MGDQPCGAGTSHRQAAMATEPDLAAQRVHRGAMRRPHKPSVADQAQCFGDQPGCNRVGPAPHADADPEPAHRHGHHPNPSHRQPQQLRSPGLSRPAPRVAATTQRRPAGSARDGRQAEIRNAVSSPGVYGEIGTCLRVGSPTGGQPSPNAARPTRRSSHRLSLRHVPARSALTWFAQYSTFSGQQQPNIHDT